MRYCLVQNTYGSWIISFPSLKLNFFYPLCLLPTRLQKLLILPQKSLIPQVCIHTQQALTIVNNLMGAFLSCCYSSWFGKKRKNPAPITPHSMLRKTPGKISFPLPKSASPAVHMLTGLHSWELQKDEFSIFTEMPNQHTERGELSHVCQRTIK